MKTALLTCLLLLSAHLGRGQINDFAPVGAKWRIYWAHLYLQNFYGTTLFYCYKDSTIDGKTCKVIYNFRYDSRFGGHQMIIYHFDKDTQKLMRWNHATSTFFLEIDFSVKVGDNYTRQIWDSVNEEVCEVTHHIQKIDTVAFIDADTAYFYFADISYNPQCRPGRFGYEAWAGCTNEPLPERLYEKANFSSLYGFSGHFLPYDTSPEFSYGIASYSDSSRSHETSCYYFLTSRDSPRSQEISYTIKHGTLTAFGNPKENLWLLDALGKTLYNGPIGTKADIDISALPAGIYFLRTTHSTTKILLP